jgi:prepilin signal peptidase PulO-like enzyme (type II secretory pathway)
MNFILFLIIFIFGTAIGSFLNCAIERLREKQDLLFTRSVCPICKHKLGFFDLIPILSFIFLKGKCRYCKKSISWQHPIVEISTALIFVFIMNYELEIMNYAIFKQFLIFNFLNLFYYLIIACLLIIIFVYDLKYNLIPDKIIYLGVGIVFFYNIFHSYFIIHNWSFIANGLISAFLSSFFFLLIFLISRGRWMGFGDVELVFLMGLFLGFPKILIALFLSFLIGAIIGLGLIAFKKKELKSEVPFGPFLMIGTFIALFWGEQIIRWYFGNLGL